MNLLFAGVHLAEVCECDGGSRLAWEDPRAACTGQTKGVADADLRSDVGSKG